MPTNFTYRPYRLSDTRVRGQAGDDLIILDHLPSITSTTNRPDDALARAVRDTIDVDGGAGTDEVEVLLNGGRVQYLVNVQDSGAPGDGADVLRIVGTDVVMRGTRAALICSCCANTSSPY